MSTVRRPLLALLACFAAAPFALQADDAANEGRFLSNTRQLIYDGKRSGEGYFHPDGNLLIFQSEREEGNPFYQMYLLNLLSGETARVSPGLGKTTLSRIISQELGVNIKETSGPVIEKPADLAGLLTSLQPRCPGQQLFPALSAPPTTVGKESIYSPSAAPGSARPPGRG